MYTYLFLYASNVITLAQQKLITRNSINFENRYTRRCCSKRNKVMLDN